MPCIPKEKKKVSEEVLRFERRTWTAVGSTAAAADFQIATPITRPHSHPPNNPKHSLQQPTAFRAIRIA